jgi:polysaccharide pyruvyl transferase WcaK-like protein
MEASPLVASGAFVPLLRLWMDSTPTLAEQAMIDGKETILVLGGTTHHNRGDRAMHDGLLHWLATALPEVELVFLANNPQLTAEVLRVRSEASPDHLLAQPWTRQTATSTRQRIATLWRAMQWLRSDTTFHRQLASARAVIIPGSGSMNSLWWHDWLYVKAAETLAARRAGVPVLMSSQGIGPAFTHWLDRYVARWMFNACALVGVRDAAQSGALLAAIGVHRQRVHHTGDDALLIAADAVPAVRWMADIPPQRLRLGINLRDSSTYGRKYPKPTPALWAKALDSLLDQGVDVQLVFVPISYDQQDDDRVAARAVIRELRCDPSRVTLIEEELDATALRGVIATLHAGLGISYHFLLFCLAANVPVLGVWQNAYYQHKQQGLFRLYEMHDHALDVRQHDAATLSTCLIQLIHNRQALADTLAQNNERLLSVTTKTRALMQHLLQSNVQ